MVGSGGGCCLACVCAVKDIMPGELLAIIAYHHHADRDNVNENPVYYFRGALIS